VLLDLNVYKKDLENKCIEQDETILELHSLISILQEKAGLSAAQKDHMVQR
jgi:mRNA-degrading endonuclease YafQ of YafQ-DinJ toxin-antitoxin module